MRSWSGVPRWVYVPACLGAAFVVLPLVALPLIFIWELTVGLWLTFKGFRPAALAALDAGMTAPATPVVTASAPVVTKTAGAA